MSLLYDSVSEIAMNVLNDNDDDDEKDNDETTQIKNVYDNNNNNHSGNEMAVPITSRIHIALNVALIILDILCMLIAVAVIICTVYRIRKCIDLIKESLQEIKDLDTFDAENEIYKIILHCRWKIFLHFIGILLDIPCVVLAMCVFITVWRSKMLYDKLNKNTDSYKGFRRNAFMQFILFIRDAIFFAPFFVIVFTFWRLPLLILGLLGKCRTPRIDADEPIHLDIKECTLELPEKGRPKLHIRAEKDNDFVLNDNLNSKCRLFVLGNELWDNVENSYGSALATAAQSMLPNKLSHGADNGFDYNLCCTNSTEMNVTFTFQSPKFKRKTIAKKITDFEQTDTEFVLQLEHDNKGILFILVVSINDFIRAANADNGMIDLDGAINMEQINEIRGIEYLGFVDTFYIIVGMEFIKWLNDIIHFVLFLCMIAIAPWRFIQCVQLLFEYENEWYMRQSVKAIGMIAHGNNIFYKLIDLLFEPMLNDLVKEKYINNENMNIENYIDTSMYYEALCHELEEFWYDNVNEYKNKNNNGNIGEISDEYSMNVNMKLANYDGVIRDSTKVLSKIKPVPVTKNLAERLFIAQNIFIYLKVMQCNCNILRMENKLQWETHSILIEQITVKQENYKNRIKYYQNAIQQSHNDLKTETELKISEKKRSKGKCKCLNGICGKPLKLTYKLIRYSFTKSLQDIMAIIILILIFVSVYRIIPLFKDTYYLFKFKSNYKKNHGVGPSLRYGFKHIIEKHIKGFMTDVSNIFQLLFWSLIILITLVRIFDYINDLFIGAIKRNKQSLTLSMAVEIAQYHASKIWEDISSVFYLLFAWKTYKYAISAGILGIFLPSAAFLEMFALLCKCLPRKVRQILSILIWFGLFIIILYICSVDISNPKINNLIIFSFITLAIIIGFFIALFICVKCRNFSDYKGELFTRESRLITRICSTCDNILNLLNVNNKTCLFCETNINTQQVYGCNLCSQYWCDQCINILRTDTELQQQIILDEEKKDIENNEYNPWIENDNSDLIPSINQPQISNNVATILWSYPTDDFIPLYIRFNWINIVAIFGILFDFFQLISILFFMFYINKIFELDNDFDINDYHHNDNVIFKRFISMSKWILLSKFDYGGYMTVSVIILIIGIFWVICSSLPLACEQLFSQWGVPNGYFTKSTLWIKTTWLYSRVFFITFAINLLKLSQCIYDGDKCIIISAHQCNMENSSHKQCVYGIISILSFALLIFFWFTTSIVLVYKNAQICWEKSDGLDIRYPLAFINGLQIFQSMYIIFGVFVILNNLKMGLLGCLMMSYLMVVWHLIYPILSKYIINETNNANHQYRIYTFSSVTYLNSLQITLYIIISYMATLLYLYVSNTIQSINVLGLLLLWGSVAILVCGVIISFIIKKKSYNRRLKKLHETELKYIIKSLTNLYENTSHNKCVGNWYKTTGYNKFQSFTQNAWATPKDLAYLLIEFERHILYERINQTFLLNRFKWTTKLLSFDKFHQFIPSINELKQAIQSPPFFSLAFNSLCNESQLFKDAPIEICFLIMQFIVDCKQNIQLADETLLKYTNLPQLDISGTYYNDIISRIKTFGSNATHQLNTYLNTLKQNNGDLEYAE